jgi:hypothetical protein
MSLLYWLVYLKMLDILTAILMTVSGDFLLLPNGLPITLAPSAMFRAATYDTSLLVDEKLTVSLAGLCYAGNVEVDCGLLELGVETL